MYIFDHSYSIFLIKLSLVLMYYVHDLVLRISHRKKKKKITNSTHYHISSRIQIKVYVALLSTVLTWNMLTSLIMVTVDIYRHLASQCETRILTYQNNE